MGKKKRTHRSWRHGQHVGIYGVVGCPYCKADIGKVCVVVTTAHGDKGLASLTTHREREHRARILRKIQLVLLGELYE